MSRLVGNKIALGLLPIAAAWWVVGCLAPGSLDKPDQFRVHGSSAGGATKGSGGHHSGSSGAGGSPGMSGDAAPGAGGDEPVTDAGGLGMGGVDGMGGADGTGGMNGTGGAGDGGSAGSGGASTNGNAIYVEAESGTVSAPMSVDMDSTASAGKYVWVASSGTRNDDPAAADMGIATVKFMVKDSGMYSAFGRIISPSTASDSFWVKMDDGAWVQWNNLTNSTAWVWDDIHDSMQADMPVHYMLDAGMHTFYVAYREAGTKLDVLAFSTDASFVPMGVAP